VCDPYRLEKKSLCLVYSFGSSNEFSFEEHLKSLLQQCEIHTFDKDKFKCPTDTCTYHQDLIGGGKNGTKNIKMIMTELGHSKRELDIVKIDIEGSEYPLFNSWFRSSTINIYPRQILFEIHKYSNDNKATHELFELFRNNGYVIFYKDPNLEYPKIASEYSMLRLTKTFTTEHVKNMTLKKNM
ncbi:unnamed protein product, partial [Didymodactylos carnosus]